MRTRADVVVGDRVRVAGVPIPVPVTAVEHDDNNQVTITYTIPGGGTYSSTGSGYLPLA